MKCPAEVYRNSERKYEGTPEKLEDPGIESRRVDRLGKISIQGAKYFLTTALRGLDVGLKPMPEGAWEVSFGVLILGQIDTHTKAFVPNVPMTKVEKKAA